MLARVCVHARRRFLNLSRNSLGPLGLRLLMDALNGNDSLTSLSLATNKLGQGSTPFLSQFATCSKCNAGCLAHLRTASATSARSQNLLLYVAGSAERGQHVE
jgi:hypothetical protein